MGLIRYALTRILYTIPMLLILLTVVFVILHVMPGNPVLVILGGRSVPAPVIAQFAHRLGFDQPIYVQYGHYLWGLLHGSLGQSFTTNEAVTKQIARHLPATLELAISGLFIAALIGIGTGIWAALRKGRVADQVLRVTHIGIYAIPIFWSGLMLQMVFGVFLRWLPTGQQLNPVNAAFFQPITNFYLIDTLLRGDWGLFGQTIVHLILPAFTLGLTLSGMVGRMARTNVLDVLGDDYVRTAKAKGLPFTSVVFKHALKNAMIPILTVVGLQFAILMGGALLTETVFSWPGIGTFLLQSIKARDFNSIQGTVVVIAVLITLVNLLVDLVYALIDPRVRYN
jgi:peptide/nickel transport system permease protein